MQCDITNNSQMNIDELSPLIDDLALHIQDKMGIESMPAITMQDDNDNADVLLGKTAQYDPQNKVITVFVTKRHPKDIMRSIAHEFIHHAQNERGDFDNLGAVGEGYAQSDEHLRNMEKEAYLKGNMCFRDWEDGYKRQMMESIHRQNSFIRRNDIMKKYKSEKNNELNRLLMEKFNFGGKKKQYDLEEGSCSGNRTSPANPKDKQTETEEDDNDKKENKVEEQHCTGGKGNRSEQEPEGEDDKEQQNEGEIPQGLKDYQKKQKAKKGDDKKEKVEEKKFPDLTGDGKVTQADILKGRGVKLGDEEDEKEEDKKEKQEESFRDRVRALMEQVLELE